MIIGRCQYSRNPEKADRQPRTRWILKSLLHESPDDDRRSRRSLAELLEHLLPRAHRDSCFPHERRLADLHGRRGELREATGKTAEALDDFDAAVRLDPNHRCCLRAPVLESGQLRRTRSLHATGKQAVTSATRACELTHWKDADLIDTLAAAYAESNEFGEAVKWQAKAVELSVESQKAALQTRLELYESGKPYRVEKN